MQVTIHNEAQQEILLSTVTLVRNSATPKNIYLFHCYVCAGRLHKIVGDVCAIDTGLVPTDDVIVVTQCRECGYNYTFQTIHAKPRRTTRLTLFYEPEHNSYHCPICRTPLLRYNADAVAILPDKVASSLPVNFTCINPRCSRQYALTEIAVPA